MEIASVIVGRLAAVWASIDDLLEFLQAAWWQSPEPDPPDVARKTRR